jgi:hypothetical protein
MMKTRYDSYCGLYCGACPILVATVKGEVEAKAAEWDLPVEDIVCHGCKTKVNAGLSADCVMRLCARDRGLDFCVECDEYPCGTVQTFERDGYPHHTLITANSEAIADGGVDVWLEEQKKRWSCPACGTAFTWYEEECAECGGKLYDAFAEEADLAEEKARESEGETAYWKLRRKLRSFR